MIDVPPHDAQVSINPCLCCQVLGSQGMVATDRVALIDAALLRPGRFAHLIYVPPPNAQVSFFTRSPAHLEISKRVYKTLTGVCCGAYAV